MVRDTGWILARIIYCLIKVNQILYIAPARTVKGGITTVINGYHEFIDQTQFHLKHVSSHRDGPRFIKVIVAVMGLIQTAFQLRFGKIELVHIHGSDKISSLRKLFYFKLVKLISRCKVIYHFHGADFATQYPNTPKTLQKQFKRFFEGADLVICLSNSWKVIIKDMAPAAKIKILPNAVRMPALTHRTFNRQRRFRMVFLGLIGKRKGVFDLLQVVKDLKAKGYDFELIIGGNGRVNELLKKVTDLGLKEIVHYRGWISASERDELLNNVDVYVLPSYGEGLPMSLLEAMSYGVPVVSSYVGGIPELITDGKNGLLIEPGDIDALSGNLEMLMTDEARRSEIGLMGRKKVDADHNLEKNVFQLEELYRALLH